MQHTEPHVGDPIFKKNSALKKNIWRWIHSVRNIAKDIVLFFARSRSNRVVFCNYGGRGFGDNPGAIAEALLRYCPKLDLVWLVKDKRTKVPSGIRTVSMRPLWSQMALTTAKVVVCNTKQHLRYHKRKRHSRDLYPKHGSYL